MGAVFITMKVKAGHKATPKVLKAYRDQQEEDRARNGHQDGYSGDFQTLDGLNFYHGEVFKTEDRAEDYIYENAEKRGAAIAVKVKEGGKEYWIIGGLAGC